MTTPQPATAAIPGERRQRFFIKRFLAHLERTRRQRWTGLDFPEERIVSREAVQAIAMEESGRTTAIELVERTAVGGPAAAAKFAAAFLPIEQDPALSVPGCHIDVAVVLASLPPAREWTPFANAFRTWCGRHLATSLVGQATHVITMSGTPLRFHVEKTPCPDDIGRLSIVPAELSTAFEMAVQEGLQHQLGKLLSASADRHILLFERNQMLWSARQLRLEIQAALEFPDVARVHEIWMIDTRGWPVDALSFRVVRPNEAS